MASPLSQSQASIINVSTPLTSRRSESYEVRTITKHPQGNEAADSDEDDDSSPFMNQVQDSSQENHSRSRSRPTSRVLSGTELSPLKILQDRPSEDSSQDSKPIAMLQSPRKMTSPEKRFPVKVKSVDETPRPGRPHERQLSLDEAIRLNEGLKQAIEIFEDETSVLENGDESVVSTVGADHHPEQEDYEAAGVDDTMVSTFSNFSVVPSMTTFAKLGQSPAKFAGGRAFRAARGEPSPSRTPRAGPLPNRAAPYETGNTTNLLDFTEQFRFANHQQQSPSRGGRISPFKTAPNMANGAATVAATPQRQSLVHLLDFDMPPLPTPRSIPTITPRELESLKSSFLSEISSLKASLSGKEAEVCSLKTAVGDAEKRVGECMEQLREERGLREQLADEKESWENRGREMENVLRKVKEEIVLGQREREELEAKLDEAGKRCEAAEMMAQEAESKMAGMRAGKAAADGASPSPDKIKSPGGSSGQREVEMAVERVARELHTAYKSKHETKVAALKKSYEARWEKKVRELEAKVEELTEESERLRAGRDATMTRLVPADAEADKERKVQAARDSAHIKELAAEVEKLEAIVKTVQGDNGELRVMLERERVEKGELVQLAEEMMSMQSFIAVDPSGRPRPANGGGGAEGAAADKKQQQQQQRGFQAPQPPPENLRSSLGRASGLKQPAQSRIGRPGHEQKNSIGGGGVPRPGSGQATRSGIMSSIEKMGSYRGRGE